MLALSSSAGCLQGSRVAVGGQHSALMPLAVGRFARASLADAFGSTGRPRLSVSCHQHARVVPKTRGLAARAQASSSEPSAVLRSPRRRGSPFLNGPRAESHLDPALAGYKNWDPLKLGSIDSEQGGIVDQKYLAYAELIHARWAMLAAAGVLAPELLGRWGVIPAETALPWFEAGGLFPDSPGGFAIPYANVDAFEYWANAPTLAWTMTIFMSFAELKRFQDYRFPGSQGKQYFLGLENVLKGSGDPKYPGGPFFNMFNMGSSLDAMDTLKDKEINNGRLAMVAMMGFGVQACVTGKSPVVNFEEVFLSEGPATTLIDLPNFGTLAGYFGFFAAAGAVVFFGFAEEERLSQAATAADVSEPAGEGEPEADKAPAAEEESAAEEATAPAAQPETAVVAEKASSSAS